MAVLAYNVPRRVWTINGYFVRVVASQNGGERPVEAMRVMKVLLFGDAFLPLIRILRAFPPLANCTIFRRSSIYLTKIYIYTYLYIEMLNGAQPGFIHH
jgi:hypothetical protein